MTIAIAGEGVPTACESAPHHPAPGLTPSRPIELSDDECVPRSAASKPSKRKSVDTEHYVQPPKKQKREKKAKEVVEKRPRMFRSKAPQSYMTLLERAQSQRMFVIERKHTGTESAPEETIHIAGTTGNLYTVVIGRVPFCSCPHAERGNQCKHMVYVLHYTLKARAELQYQLAFLNSEVQEIIANAPPIASETVDPSSPEDSNGVRKPIEDDCGICCVEFDEASEEIVYCRAACGQNVHKQCFQKWAAAKKASGSGVTCPYCRSAWQADKQMLGAIDKAAGKITSEGYTNVASQLGISGLRDTSTYHSFWVRNERREGRLLDEDPESIYY